MPVAAPDCFLRFSRLLSSSRISSKFYTLEITAGSDLSLVVLLEPPAPFEPLSYDDCLSCMKSQVGAAGLSAFGLK